MRRHPLVEGEIYHIYNRGVEKRDIFLNENDYLRFIYNLLVLNKTDSPPRNTDRILQRKEMLTTLCKAGPCTGELVEILVFELMPKHFHLMLRQLADGGITKFLQKLGTAYTMYFNTKYDRVGPLFQGRFKSVLVEKDAHFLYLPHYIHFNSLDLMPAVSASDTVQGRTVQGPALHSCGEKMKFLENYKWSSFPDYIGKRNFPSVTKRDFILDNFGGEKGYKKAVKEWLVNKHEEGFTDIAEVLLD